MGLHKNVNLNNFFFHQICKRCAPKTKSKNEIESGPKCIENFFVRVNDLSSRCYELGSMQKKVFMETIIAKFDQPDAAAYKSKLQSVVEFRGDEKKYEVTFQSVYVKKREDFAPKMIINSINERGKTR